MNLNTKIDLKNIDFDKVKAFLKRKETIIAIIVLIFIGGIIFAGNVLIDNYLEAIDKREMAKSSYERITRSDTNVESLGNKIEAANIENEEILSKLVEIDRKQVADFLLDIQKDTGLSWNDKDRSFLVKSEIKNAPGIKGISVSISKFDGTYENIKSFLEYIKNYDREVSIDTLTFSRDPLTGRMNGNMTLMFYMKNNEATQEEN